MGSSLYRISLLRGKGEGIDFLEGWMHASFSVPPFPPSHHPLWEPAALTLLLEIDNRFPSATSWLALAGDTGRFGPLSVR